MIHMGFTPFEIAERMGYEAEKITLKYAHLFPDVQDKMAERLEQEPMNKGKEDLYAKNPKIVKEGGETEQLRSVFHKESGR